MLFVLLFGLFCIISSGGGDGSDDATDDTSTELTTDEAEQISDILIDVMNDVNNGMQESTTQTTQSVSPQNFTYTETDVCNTSENSITFAVSGEYPCQAGGHVTVSGNLKTWCDEWMYYTDPTVYCTCTGEYHTQNALTFQFGDPTNNLNDCDEGGDVIIDGTIYVDASGTVDDLTISITGTLGVNRRGPTGGLILISDEIGVSLYYSSATETWTGHIGNIIFS